MKTPKLILLLISVAVYGLVGCGGPKHNLESVKTANDANIQKMAGVYRLYASRFGYTGPKSKEELLSFLKTEDSIAANLERMGLDRQKIDEYFISENDGQEFEFRWGAFVNPDLSRCKEPIVFEQVGKNGVRLVILSNRKVLEVDNDKKYQKLFKGEVDVEEAKTDAEKDEEAAG